MHCLVSVCGRRQDIENECDIRPKCNKIKYKFDLGRCLFNKTVSPTCGDQGPPTYYFRMV